MIGITEWRNDYGVDVRALLIDGEIFRWGLSDTSIEQAKQIWLGDPSMHDEVLFDIYRHFLTALSKFMGREITIKEVNEALDDSGN